MKRIFLTRGMEAIVDDDVYLKVARFKWFALKCGNLYYAKNNTYGSLHRYIFALDGVDISGLCVDHIDHNTLNNLRSNLRVVNKRENSRNAVRNVEKHSRYVGVCKAKHVDRWTSKLKVGNKTIHLGYYETAELAGLAYDRAVLFFYGEDRVLNFPEKKNTHDLHDYKDDTKLKLYKSNSSGYRGVHIRGNRFSASIHVGGRKGSTIHLGTFDTAIEAARAYDNKFYELKGFSETEMNFPEEQA